MMCWPGRTSQERGGQPGGAGGATVWGGGAGGGEAKSRRAVWDWSQCRSVLDTTRTLAPRWPLGMVGSGRGRSGLTPLVPPPPRQETDHSYFCCSFPSSLKNISISWLANQPWPKWATCYKMVTWGYERRGLASPWWPKPWPTDSPCQSTELIIPTILKSLVKLVVKLHF